MLRRIAAAAAALALVATLTSSPARAQALTISGMVTDSRSGLGMENVCITVGVPGRFCWTVTNSAGQYFIDLAAVAAQPGQDWDLYFIREGFDTKTGTVRVDGDEKLNMTMTPTPGVTPPATVPPRSNVLNPPPAVTFTETYKVYLPNVVKTLGGANGWHTPFIVQNVGSGTTTLGVSFYRFSDGSLVKTRGAMVEPGRSFVDSPRDEADLPGDTQFSVVVTSSNAPVVVVVNEHQGPGAGNEALAYSGISKGAKSVYLPLVSNMVNSWLTTMIAQNLGTSTATVVASFKSFDGTRSTTINKTIQPGRSAAIDPRGEASLVAGVEYTATFTSAQDIAVVANNHHDLPGVTPVMGDSYGGVAIAADAKVYMPWVAKNVDGQTTRIVIQNAGTAAAKPLVQLHPYGIGTTVTVESPTIDPGEAWSFTPTAADGEYALTIDNGRFAAVATVIGAQTAMFYTGTHETQTKLFAPNVTRKLTQDPATDPGWNTPILIQSAGASEATLTWYSFDAGTFVLRRSVSLDINDTTRVDPAATSGLADNSQYAVTIDADGRIVAIVTEKNAKGGDNAMIYKGFETPTQ